ncbi:hypothetical protein G8S55_03535 [Clostridium botulinum C]|uniref:hypothetical protein n=1 Tax=Clostridium botulinum TaxID=1491 RepID=UPI001E4E2CF5|nr:hypothetical protein [Clostridium botulinum]MCD3216325.1 hypothetical protein [Clostridium botulinum C]
MIYDIRTAQYAQQTLTNLTGIPLSVWKQYLGHEHEYKFTDYLVADVIKCNGYMPCSCKDLEFIYFHVTTSANICTSFRKHGILDLKQSYLCNDSELRIFLENHDIHINLDDRILIYGEQEFDITFGDCPSRNTEAYNCWSIGRKFYFDYTICGFLSVTERSAYGGQVHRRPEILKDIDKLFGLNLSREWMSTHDSYEVVAKVSGEKVIYDSDENQSDEDKILYYLTKAYLTAFSEPSENILMLKNNIQIPPRDIVKIKPMKYWKDC